MGFSKSDIRLVYKIFLNVLVLFIQLPLSIYHFLGLDDLLFYFRPPFNNPDNVIITSATTDSSSLIVDEKTASFKQKIVDATDIVDIVHAHGFKVHEHVIQTKDGYLLSIHRILPLDKDKSNNDRPIVYLHHGLLTNSELFVLGETTEKCLPFVLINQGYDVWLGNNRGNKYSRKHLVLSSSDESFWNYSLDEFAMFDIPNTIDYILDITKQRQLSYIGFSQGAAQGLASLSLNHNLNSKIRVFIGLSPAMIPKGLNNPVCSFLVQSTPGLFYRLFGKRAILPSVVFWQKLMGPSLYEKVVDLSLIFLFNWKSGNIPISQKKMGYPHMFSPSSVKSVLHWFQIIDNKRFQMFDEGGASGSSLVYFSGTAKKTNRVAPFPTQTVSVPCLLIYGKSDMLIDIDTTLQNLSCPTKVVALEGYEHMDTLWSTDVESAVFEPVLNFLSEFDQTSKPHSRSYGH